MSDSEEEGEILPDFVKDYYCFDDNEEPVPLATLPLLWSDHEVVEDVQTQVFLGGTADDGSRVIRKRVTAWKFQLSHAEPVIFVLSKDKTWIQLQSPKRSYQDLNKSLLITVHYIHFLNKNPEASEKFQWNYLQETFSKQDSEPSKKDLIAHMALIKEAAARNENLAKSKFLLSFTDDSLERSETSDEEGMDDIEDSLEHTETPYEQSPLSLDGNSLEISETPLEDDTEYCMEEYSEYEFAESVCAICDNGGEILSCEGDCMRSFHATETDGCEGLGFDSDAQVEAIQTFLCENCKYNKHQCFACGKLGSSDRSSSAEVFQCISATCGHYYHPKCVADLLHPDDVISAIDQRVKISRGEKFTCPAHKCEVCHQIEDSMICELQFALCRRCPRAYHRKCLPREISFESSWDAPQRAWDDLLPNRVLIYCMKHVIEPALGTPARDHLKFRNKPIKLVFRKTPLSTNRTEKPAMEMPTTAVTSCTREKAAEEECRIKKKHIDSARRYLKQNQSSQDDDNNRNSKVRSQAYPTKDASLNLGPYPDERKTNFVRPDNQTENEKISSSKTAELENRRYLKQNRPSVDNSSGKGSIPKISDFSSEKKVSFNLDPYAQEKRKTSSVGTNQTKNEQTSRSVETRRYLKQERSSNENDNGESSVVKRSQPYPANNLGPDTLKRRKTCFPGKMEPNNHSRNEQTSSSETTEMQNMIRKLISESDASFDAVEFMRKRNLTSTSSNAMMIKNITLGKVQQYVGATRAALQILEADGTVDEAKAICHPSIVLQIVKWNMKLGVYMAPFLSGPRYSPFGRHFTKLEKLKEIADRLKWYIQSGDTIVDFCCGSNDFSCLMKEKLDEIEKPCSFKNYDLFPPQNIFCFERRDWHTVDVKELPEGSKLIMGLNPPFGVKASLANKFISKALEFKPKLLILIVPDETKSLGTGPNPYDLIWKDSHLLHGKAFYIPGSIDNRNQKMEDWNKKPPGVYLWSRPDWSSRHKALAEEHGHKDGMFHIAAKAALESNFKKKGVADAPPVYVTNEMPPEPSNPTKDIQTASKQIFKHKALAEENGHKDGMFQFHIAAKSVGSNFKKKGVPNAPPLYVTNEMPAEPSNQLAEESVELHEAGGACGKETVIEEDSGMNTATSSSSLESESSVESESCEAAKPTNQAEGSLDELQHESGSCGKDMEIEEDPPGIDIAISSPIKSKKSPEDGKSESADLSVVEATNQEAALHNETEQYYTSYPPEPDNPHSQPYQQYQGYSNSLETDLWWNYQQPSCVPDSHYLAYGGNLAYHLGPSYCSPSSMFTYVPPPPPPTHHYPLYQTLPPPPPPPPGYLPTPQPPPPGTAPATSYTFRQP